MSFKGEKHKRTPLVFRSVPLNAPGPGERPHAPDHQPQRQYRGASNAVSAGWSDSALCADLRSEREQRSGPGCATSFGTCETGRYILRPNSRRYTARVARYSCSDNPAGIAARRSAADAGGLQREVHRRLSGRFSQAQRRNEFRSPLFMTVQAEPGLPYNTESGFLNTMFPARDEHGHRGTRRYRVAVVRAVPERAEGRSGLGHHPRCSTRHYTVFRISRARDSHHRRCQWRRSAHSREAIDPRTWPRYP